MIGKAIGKLSKGFRQRVGMAQVLLHEPDVLILDEPTAGLDPNQIREVRDTIRRLGQSKTILLSTHILQEVDAIASRVLFINEGRVGVRRHGGGVRQGRPSRSTNRFHRLDACCNVASPLFRPTPPMALDHPAPDAMNVNVIRAIFRRNFFSYFSNPTGYVFICVFVMLSFVRRLLAERVLQRQPGTTSTS